MGFCCSLTVCVWIGSLHFCAPHLLLGLVLAFFFSRTKPYNITWNWQMQVLFPVLMWPYCNRLNMDYLQNHGCVSLSHDSTQGLLPFLFQRGMETWAQGSSGVDLSLGQIEHFYFCEEAVNWSSEHIWMCFTVVLQWTLKVVPKKGFWI